MGYADVVALLIDHGAELDAQTSRGETPLWNAAANGRAPAVLVLLNRGVCVVVRRASCGVMGGLMARVMSLMHKHIRVQWT
jgi:hypothetical protein